MIRKRHIYPFLKGPIPLAWLTTASALPGKALAVGIVIWFRAGLHGRRDDLPINLRRMQGVTRSSASRGLAALERAGLVSAVRYPGRKPRVTILGGPREETTHYLQY